MSRSDLAAADPNDGGRAQIHWPNAGDDVSELVDMENPRPFAGRREAEEIRDPGADRAQRRAPGQPGRDGRKDVPPVECRAYRIQEILLVRNVMQFRVLVQAQRQQAVVWANEQTAPVGPCNRSPLGADSRVDHRDMDRTSRKESCRRKKNEGARQDVVRRHAVADVDDPGFGHDSQDHALHAADIAVVGPEVRG